MDLQSVDPDAQIFNTTDELLGVFGGLSSDESDGDSNSEADSDSEVDSDESQGTIEPTISDVTIYLDLNNNGELDEDEPSQVTDENGEYSFTGLEAGTYYVR